MKTKYRTRAIEFNKPNKNGRVYTKENFEKNNNIGLMKELVNNHMCFIELGCTEHPLIDMLKVAGIVTDIDLNDEGLDIEYEIIDTPCGRILQSLFDAGETVEVTIGGNGEEHWDNEKQHYTVSDYAFNKFFFTGEKA